MVPDLTKIYTFNNINYRQSDMDTLSQTKTSLPDVSPVRSELLPANLLLKTCPKVFEQASNSSNHHNHHQKRIKKPKRNRSAFIIFSAEKRAEINAKIQKQDKLNSNEMMVKLGEMWGNLTKEEKKQFYAKAAKDKIRYLGELSQFQRNHPAEDIKNRTKKNHIKKPCSAYAIFVKEMKVVIKQERPDLKMADVLKVVAERWKELNDVEKYWYQEKAREEKESFNAKMEMNSGSDQMEMRSEEDLASEIMDEVGELECTKKFKPEMNGNCNVFGQGEDFFGSDMKIRSKESSGDSMFLTTRSHSRLEVVENGKRNEQKIIEDDFLEFPDLDLQDLDLLKDRDVDSEGDMIGFDGELKELDLNTLIEKRSSEVILDFITYEREMSMSRINSGKENRDQFNLEDVIRDEKMAKSERLHNVLKNLMRNYNENVDFSEEDDIQLGHMEDQL